MRFISVILISLSFGSLISSDFNLLRANDRWDGNFPISKKDETKIKRLSISYPQLNRLERAELEEVIGFTREMDGAAYEALENGPIRNLVRVYQMSQPETAGTAPYGRPTIDHLGEVETKVEVALKQTRTLALERTLDELRYTPSDRRKLTQEDLQRLKETRTYAQELAKVAIELYENVIQKIDEIPENKRAKERAEQKIKEGHQGGDMPIIAYLLNRKIDFTPELLVKIWIIQELAQEADAGLSHEQSADHDLHDFKEALPLLLEMDEFYRKGLRTRGH